MFARFLCNLFLEVQTTAPAAEQSDGNMELWMIVLISVSVLLLLAISIRSLLKKTPETDKRFGLSVADLNKMIEPYGFACMENEDIFYSTIDAWQRKYGYCHLFDEAAAPCSMIIDCEPIYFEFDNKYGLTTGAEVGIYNIEKGEEKIKDFDTVRFKCALNSEMLPMSFELLKNGKPIIRRNDRHWWLTGFLLGEFSQPEELSMRINIDFNSYIMRNAFIDALISTEYTSSEYSVSGSAVSVVFSNPHTRQPASRTAVTDELTQKKNKEMCSLYHKLTDKYPTMPQKLNALYAENPKLLDRALSIGKQMDFHKSFKRKSK